MATAARLDAAVGDRRRNRPDVLLVLGTLALSVFGLVMIYSATRFGLERAGSLATIGAERQMVFVTAGIIAMFAFSLIDYREYRNYLPLIYSGMILLLVAVFLFPEVNGARRWIPLGVFNFQPAEFAKIVTILTGAHILSRTQEDESLSWRRLAQVILVMAIPAGLILVEPDLGTTMTIPFVMFVMLFAGGATMKQMSSLFITAFLGVAAMFRFGLLREHQLDRLRVFIDPAVDPQGIGYQLRQSKLAIGSGQLVGRGLFQGTQTNFAYIPEQETDFIFTAVGEQLGFVGGIVVLAIFFLVVWRLLVISSAARDRFGSLVAIGVAGMLMFHVFVNIGMTIGIAPVTGLPLPFLSQGGSFYIAMAMSIGISNSVWLRRSPVPERRR